MSCFFEVQVLLELKYHGLLTHMKDLKPADYKGPARHVRSSFICSTTDRLDCFYEFPGWFPHLVLLTWFFMSPSLVLRNNVLNLKTAVCAITLPWNQLVLQNNWLETLLHNERERLCPWKLLSTLHSIAAVYNPVHFQCFATNLLVFAISLPRGESESPAGPVVSERA